jgi:NAD(P)-dependent dehydrogenase (short-subunit alcohol dehydrogenase family)
MGGTGDRGMSARTAIAMSASRGIGASVAERLALDGFAAVANYSGSEAAAEALVGKIEAAGWRVVGAKSKVADDALGPPIKCLVIAANVQDRAAW